MENRYLYRAKRTDNGEWIVGNLLVDKQQDVETREQIEIVGIYPSEYKGFAERIDPSTICQCTGLKDDDGTLIFENDVLSLKDEINECEWKAVVKFGNPNAEYTWGWQLVPITECDANKDILLWVETEMGYMYCDIIGNRFDNPELLEV